MAKTVSKKKAAGSTKATSASEGKAVGAKKVAKKKAAGKAPSSTQKVLKSSVASKPTAKKKATSKATAATKKTAAKKVSAKKTAAKKAPEAEVDAVAKKVTAKKVAAKKVDAVTQEPTAKKAAAKKTTTKKTATKKTVAKKATSKKVSAKAASNESEVAVEKKAKKKSAKSTPSIAVGEQVSATVVAYEREKNNHYMDKDQLAHFSQKLAEWKQQLMEEVDRTVGHMKDDATNFPDPNDRATQEEEFSLELRTRDRERKLIKKINEAQKRIEELEYGYCETCGVEIGVGRLEARPTAELCIDCKTLEEIREKQIA